MGRFALLLLLSHVTCFLIKILFGLGKRFILFNGSILCLRSESTSCCPCVAPVLPWHISSRCYIWQILSPICRWRMGSWITDACLKMHPFWGPLNWQTLCLKNDMKTNVPGQAAVNDAAWTLFCPTWSAIMCFYYLPEYLNLSATSREGFRGLLLYVFGFFISVGLKPWFDAERS